MLAAADHPLRALVAPLLPDLAASAEEADRERRLPRPIVEQARSAGLFRLVVPRAFGGLEADLPGYLALLEDVSTACGSFGWCLAVAGGVLHALMVQFAPEQAREVLEAAGRGAILSGTLPPHGRAEPCDGGYRISGRWPFASLTEHADVRMVGVSAPGPPPNAPDPRLETERHLRYVLIDTGTPGVTLHDTWHALSMRGSGSCDIELTGVRVPEARTAPAALARFRPDMQGIARVPFSITQGMSLAAIAAGIALAALDAVTARAKQPRGAAPPAGAAPALQLAVAESAVEIAAGRALLAREAGSAWLRAQDEAPVSVTERTPWWMAAHGCAEFAVRAVGRLYAHSGAHALYDDAPLQRYFRDVRVPQHHIHLHPGETAQDIGRALLGRPTERYNW